MRFTGPSCNAMVRRLGFSAQCAFAHPLLWVTPGKSRKAPVLCGYLSTQVTWKALGWTYGEVGLAYSPLVTVVWCCSHTAGFPQLLG